MYLDSFTTYADCPHHLWDQWLDLLYLCTYEATQNFNPKPDSARLVPQAEEVTAQNVKYLDSETGYIDTVNSYYDSLRIDGTKTDLPLEDFFSRPVKIADYVWQIASPFDFGLNPWKEYFDNPRVSNRVNNYKLMQCKLHVKFLVNGTPFHYGRLMASYVPMSYYDEFYDISGDEVVNVLLSQRKHLYINPSINDGGEMVLPFYFWKNAMDMTKLTDEAPGETYDTLLMGGIIFRLLNQLKHANGGTDSVNISVYAWAEDVRLAMPTQKAVQGLTPQADEYGTGPFSKPASAVANFMSGKGTWPIIGRYARATEIGATAMGKMASLFGYSRPAMLTTSEFRPITKGSLAVTNIPDDVAKLTVDCKQELSIDPGITGVDDGDSLVISKIACVESYYANFNWNNGTPTEERLFSTIVDPMLGLRTTIPPDDLWALPAMSFAAVPFKYWRGSIKFRFQVVCSRFHKGRLKVVFDPVQTELAADYNTAYTTVVDISDTTDFTITCAWGQANSYREIMPLGQFSPPYSTGSAPIAYDADDNDFGSGVLSVYCVNDITAPGPDSNVAVNVFVSAGDDIEFAVPHGEVLSRLRLLDDVTAQIPAIPPLESRLIPQAEEEGNDAATAAPDNPKGTPSIDTDGAILPITDAANMIHFGESVRSFRQLLKRYTHHEAIPFTDSLFAADLVVLRNIQRSAMPFSPGYTRPLTDPTDKVPLVVTDGQYAYGDMTLLKYLTSGFAGWRGGIRYLIDLSEAPCCSIGGLRVGRYGSCTPENLEEQALDFAFTKASQAQRVRFTKQVTGIEGVAIQSQTVNPTISFEVPFYSNYRFIPARSRDFFGEEVDNLFVKQPCWKINYTFTPQKTNQGARQCLHTWVAAGEDFNLSWFQGAPLLKLENAPPTT